MPSLFNYFLIKIRRKQQQHSSLFLIFIYLIILCFTPLKFQNITFNNNTGLIESEDDCLSPIKIGLLLPEQYRQRIDPWLSLSLKHLHQILKSSPLALASHCLQLAPKDTACKTSLGMKALFDLMGPQESGGKVVALFGDICTDVNEPVAMAAKSWNIVHLSFTETHAKFGTADSKELYPSFFRIAPGDLNFNRARKELIKAFGWRRVGSIKQSDHSSLALAHERLTTKLELGGVQVVYTASLSGESNDQAIEAELDELKHRDVHIFIADLSRSLALRVFCVAFRLGLYGNNFAWILPGFKISPDGTINNFWWQNNYLNIQTNCSLEEIEEVLTGHFALDQALIRPYEKGKEEILASGKTPTQILEEFHQNCLQEYGSNTECQTDSLAHSSYAYDGILALGLALNKSLILKKGEEHEFEIDKKLFVSKMRKTDFEGLSGRVRFDDKGERLGLVQIQQLINGSYSIIGFLDNADGRFQLNKDIDWIPPADSTLLLRRREYVSALLLIIMCSLAFAGICLALIFLIVNIKFRNHRFIKMSSPVSIRRFEQFCYVSIRRFEQFCYAKVWILCFGFTLAFGSMFSKTWRVHSIFTNIRRDKKAIKDSKLYLIVACLLAMDGAVLLLWALISPFRLSLAERGQFREENMLIIPELEHCESSHSVVFQLVFAITKGLLMLFGCFLAWETRAVNVPALNDSKYIGIAVYAIVVMCAVGLALALILQDHLNEAFGLISIFIIFGTTLTLCLVFVPKIVELWKTPKNACEQQKHQRKGMMKSVVGGKNNSSLINSKRSAGGTTTTKTNSTTTQEGLHRQLSLISPEEMLRRSGLLEVENLRLHQTLVEKSNHLKELLEKVKELAEQLGEIEDEKILIEEKQQQQKNIKKSPIHLGIPQEEEEDNENTKRRLSARTLTAVVQQFRLRRTKTSSCLE
uniref:G-protein coupled receptors family 3 profile domain-containing protein n=1 Tax=Meloidogyne incognita TaxID=6306 RepID=A0A914KP27_MELIC